MNSTSWKPNLSFVFQLTDKGSEDNWNIHILSIVQLIHHLGWANIGLSFESFTFCAVISLSECALCSESELLTTPYVQCFHFKKLCWLYMY